MPLLIDVIYILEGSISLLVVKSVEMPFVRDREIVYFYLQGIRDSLLFVEILIFGQLYTVWTVFVVFWRLYFLRRDQNLFVGG